MATNILFMYQNRVDEAAAILTASSEASGFPATNLQHPFRTKTWVTNAGTANIVIDLGQAYDIDSVVLANYSWSSAPSTLDLEFNSSDSWGSPAATEALTWAVRPTANGNEACIVKSFTTHTYRYVRLNVVYGAQWSLGRIFLGSSFIPTYNFNARDYSLNLVDPSIVSASISGQRHFDILNNYREIDFAFGAVSQAQLEAFQLMFNTVGTHNSLFISMDYDNEPNEMTMYGDLSQVMTTGRMGPEYYPISFKFTESL